MTFEEMDAVTKKELWQRFIKTGRVSDYLAYTKAQEQSFLAPQPGEDLSAEFAQSFFDVPADAKEKDVQDNDDTNGWDRAPGTGDQ